MLNEPSSGSEVLGELPDCVTPGTVYDCWTKFLPPYTRLEEFVCAPLTTLATTSYCRPPSACVPWMMLLRIVSDAELAVPSWILLP